ncbi:MAG: Crp/Fnr family transcriptional regulator [Chitinophagaceae bacterium]|nr:Crp/Fnr family transcriptional regulator [Chitinophagaceae bacterium]
MMIPVHFKDIFEPGLLREMEKKTEIKSVKAGDILLEVGQIVRGMPIVLSGSLRVLRIDEEGREILLYYISSDESCAMTFTCCMEHFPSEIKVVAEDDADLLMIPIRSMDEWMRKYATWKSFVMRTIRNRFNDLLRTIDQIAFQKLDERLVYYLKEKSKATGSTLINLSHEQIANELATSRVVISRLLKKLEIDKKVLLYRNQIKVLNAL